MPCTRSAIYAYVVVASISILIISISIFLQTTHKPFITSAFAVDTVGIGVFWDRDCTQNVYSLDWGTLQPGSAKDVALYVWNRMNESVFLSMRTEDWVPSNAYESITVSLHHDSGSIEPDGVMKITLTIRSSPYVKEITNFTVNIVLSGLSHPRSDINQDRKIDIKDIAIAACAYGSTAGSLRWDPLADVNDDGKIDIHDIAIVANDFGISY